jgi:hypothetical protein
MLETLIMAEITTWYYATNGYLSEVREVEAVRETSIFVFFPNGKREQKVSSWGGYYKKRKDAEDHIQAKIEAKLEVAKEHLQDLQRRLIEFKHKRKT